MLSKNCFENPSEENHRKHRQQRNLVTKAIKNARLCYNDNLTKKKNKRNKILFSAFSEICTDKKSVELNIRSEFFNDYLAGIGRNLASSFNETDILSIALLCHLLLNKKSQLLLDH